MVERVEKAAPELFGTSACLTGPTQCLTGQTRKRKEKGRTKTKTTCQLRQSRWKACGFAGHGTAGPGPRGPGGPSGPGAGAGAGGGCVTSGEKKPDLSNNRPLLPGNIGRLKGKATKKRRNKRRKKVDLPFEASEDKIETTGGAYEHKCVISRPSKTHWQSTSKRQSLHDTLAAHF